MHRRPHRGRDLLLWRQGGRRRAAVPRGLARRFWARRGHDHIRRRLENNVTINLVIAVTVCEALIVETVSSK